VSLASLVPRSLVRLLRRRHRSLALWRTLCYCRRYCWWWLLLFLFWFSFSFLFLLLLAPRAIGCSFPKPAAAHPSSEDTTCR
ncbi:unnamed protein product, partial [Polarella glacialis]